MKSLTTGELYRLPNAFIGELFAITLISRGADGHAMVEIWVEDDGFWSTTSGPSYSSVWHADLLKVMKRVDYFLRRNCPLDPSGYGYLMPLKNHFESRKNRS